MDSLTQAAHDGDVAMVAQILMAGEGSVKAAFSEAIRAGQNEVIDYLMPYLDNRTLQFIAAEAQYRKNEILFQKIKTYLHHPTPKSLPAASRKLAFTSCMMSEDQFSEFQIIYTDPLGEGGYGKVYTGYHAGTRSEVAIKVMLKNLISPADIQIIQHECLILSHLDHPHIIKIYGGYEDDTNYYWILSLLKGGSVEDYIRNRNPVSIDLAFNLFQQLVSAIQYCHHQNIVHRDIKPDNILIGTDFQIVLADFGYATMQPPGHLLSDFLGTNDYMSPEIKSYTPYDGKAADIWALGITLYFIYYGSIPSDPPEYQDDNISSMIRWLLNPDPTQRPTIDNIAMAMSRLQKY